MTIALIEYSTATSKPTGRLCRIPDTTREQMHDLLTLYGFTGDYGQYTGRLEAYHPMHWCFVYQSSMEWHPGEHVELYELIAP
jgi:hypothetical protein